MPSENIPLSELPPIPAKRYFTIGEVSELCMVKPHVLRYWEQEFGQLRPVKRRGNRRYYQHHEVLLVRRIRELLYGEGFTIIGARGRLDEEANGAQPLTRRRGSAAAVAARAALEAVGGVVGIADTAGSADAGVLSLAQADELRQALLTIAESLDPSV
jgi:DNA-binding transcriptional MerR regulator